MIEGPITGGARGWPFGRPLFDLSTRGYVEAEYFLTGEATTYRQDPKTEWGRDGRWRAEVAGRTPFKTRLLVYRPADAGRFNGTAIVSWNNVTAGYELFGGESPEILEGGYAFVAASVQRVGVHGFPANNQGLAAWDPERYGALSIPTDDASYDIFTQAARAVGPNRERGGVDPMAGLDVRRVIGIGASQSAGRLATYVNAVHPLARAFDGFLLQIYFGRGTPLEVGSTTVNVDMTRPLGGADPMALMRQAGLGGTNLIRDDLDVPVMVVNSELEAMACYGVRQPDTDRYRCWEAAGTSHVSHPVSLVRAEKYQRDFGEPLPVLEGMNRISITPLYDAAIHHLNRWVNGGAPPPSQPPVAFAGDPPEVQRDAHGIALGGVRLPQADAPVATHSAIPLAGDLAHLLRGSSRPFDAETLDGLYRDEAAYRARFEAAAQRAVAAGVLLARDVGPAVEEAVREYRRARGAKAMA
jgi:hypothetical protein